MPDARSLIERGLRHERGGVLEEALRCYAEAASAAADPVTESEALRRQADVMRIRCDWDAAIALAVRSERVAREAGLADAAGEALNAQALVHQSRGDLDQAAPIYGRILDTSHDPRIRGIALQNLGAISATRGDYEAAATYFADSLDCFTAAKYERGSVIVMNNLGRAWLDRGDPVQAEDVLNRAVAAARATGDLELSSVALVNLAEALVARGAYAEAEEQASAALGFFKVSGNRWRQVECLRLIGDLRRDRQDAEVARRLYRQALSVADEIGAHPEADQLRGRLTELGDVDLSAES